MQPDLFRYIMSLFSRDAVWKAADALGENKGDLNNALEQTITAILHSISAKLTAGQDTGSEWQQLATDAGNNEWANLPVAGEHDSHGTEILNTIFGEHNVQHIAAGIAADNGLKESSALAVMKWAAPACLSAIGKYTEEQRLGEGAPAMPDTESGGLGHAGMAAEKKPGSMKMFWPLLLLLITFAAWWFLKSRNNDNEAPVPGTAVIADMNANGESPQEPSTVQPDAAPAFTLNADSTLTYALGDTVIERLPDSTVLRVPANSAEAQLLAKIREAMRNGLDTTEDGKKNGWVNLYSVQFSKQLNYREGALQQITNIAAILKAYPSVYIKLGGYTDNTGPAAINEKLSRQRAEKVAAGIRAAGAGAQVTGAEGYGPDFPIADNNTAEGRARNRRVSCRIVRVK